jgi:hypothetical protein
VYYLPFRAFPRQVGAHVEDNIPEGALLAADAELVQLAHDLSLHAAARWQGEPGQRDDDSTKSTSYQARGIGVAAAAAATLWPDTHTLQSTCLKIQRHPPTKLAGEILRARPVRVTQRRRRNAVAWTTEAAHLPQGGPTAGRRGS